MSDKPYYGEETPTIRLRTWAFGQMVWGAFLAGIFVLVIVVTLGAIYAVSLLLPEESKTTPSPYGALEQPLLPTGHDLA